VTTKRISPEPPLQPLIANPATQHANQNNRFNIAGV
jgi:hypothetical protein